MPTATRAERRRIERRRRKIREAARRALDHRPGPPRTLVIDAGDPEKLDLVTVFAPGRSTAVDLDRLADDIADSIAANGGELVEVLDDIGQLAAATSPRRAQA